MISPTLNTDSALIAADAGGEIASLDRFIAAARKLSLMKRISDASPSVHVANTRQVSRTKLHAI